MLENVFPLDSSVSVSLSPLHQVCWTLKQFPGGYRLCGFVYENVF